MKKLFLAMMCLALAVSTASAKDDAAKDTAAKDEAVTKAVKFEPVADDDVITPAGSACACAKVVVPTPTPTPKPTPAIIDNNNDGGGLTGQNRTNVTQRRWGQRFFNSRRGYDLPQAPAPSN